MYIIPMDEAEEQTLDSNNNGSKEIESSVELCNEEQKQTHSFDSLLETNDFNESEFLLCLNELSEDDLLLKLRTTNKSNGNILKENDVYKSTLKRDEIPLHTGEMPPEIAMKNDEDTPLDQLILLSWPLKCYYARNRLKILQKAYEQEKSSNECRIQEFQFKLETLNRSLNDLKISKENFHKNVRIGGQHPVTKRVILQKVAKFFDDSIKSKMAITNRYKIQIQSNTMDCNKLLSQIKEQEKRLASLDLVKYQEAKFEYEKSCKSLIKHRDQLAKCKSKFSSLNQTVLETKKNLVKEKSRMEQMNAAVLKKEYLKKVILSEKARNDEKVKALNVAMRKMRLDPRRHDLPEVSEYAKVKKENEILKQNVIKWKKKVELVEQTKRLHLSALMKKTQLR